MELGRQIRLDLPYAQALKRVKEVFADNGFGTLTEIDVRATLQEKLGEEMEDYAILGVCNPQLAHRALGIDRRLGLLLPCTVVVRSDGDATIVDALNPQVMVQVPGNEDLHPVADEAAARIESALSQLA